MIVPVFFIQATLAKNLGDYCSWEKYGCKRFNASGTNARYAGDDEVCEICVDTYYLLSLVS